jgi:two-component system, OmpR family, alkaline phosphatase synthesis response regulator PhoP
MSRKRILLIDDEEDIREVAVLALETAGDYEVLTAAGGQKGIETAAAQQPDIILLDVMMPELDGPSTLARLRAREETREIPVIFLTAKVQASERRSLTALPVAGIIAKPFDPLTLGDEVAALAAWS